MVIKKLLSCILIFMLSLVLCFCSPYKAKINIRDDEKIGDERFQKIIDALENKDKEILKNMFSIKVLNEANDIDSNIEFLMQFYKGKGIVTDSARQGFDSNDYGERTSELRCLYWVTTDEDKYMVFFIEQIVDTKNPDNVGLNMLQIIKEEDREKEFDWGGNKTRCIGIYRSTVEK